MSHDQSYNLIITGPIGAGKTTLIKKIANYYKEKKHDFGVVPEYIDGMIDGPNKLHEWINGDISLEEFQQYINNSMDILNQKVNDKPFKIYERTPIECAEIFSKESDIYEKVLVQAWGLHMKYSIPHMFHCAPYSMYINANQNENRVFKRVKKIIEKDLKRNITWRLIYLRVDVDKSIMRVKRRGRKSEKSYHKEYLQFIIDRYEDLFFDSRYHVYKIYS